MRHGERAGWLGALVIAALSAGAGYPAQAETMKQCSVQFQAAKKAGTLNGADWKSFRAAQCGGKNATTAASGLPVAAADPLPAATPAASASPAVASARPAASPAPVTQSAGKSAIPANAAAPAPLANGNATFPHALDSKYATLAPGKARMKTCVDQYNANKSSGGAGNGGLKWIEKGGGYYSQCVKRLKAG